MKLLAADGARVGWGPVFYAPYGGLELSQKLPGPLELVGACVNQKHWVLGKTPEAVLWEQPDTARLAWGRCSQ